MLYLTASSINGGWSMFSMIAQLFFILLVFAAVVALAIFSTKWVASAKYIKRGNNNLQLMDSMSIGYQSAVHLLKCGNKYILIGVTKDKITMLTEVQKEELEITEKLQGRQKAHFEKYLGSFIKTDGIRKDDDKND